MGVLSTPNNHWVLNDLYFDIPQSINEYLEFGEKLILPNNDDMVRHYNLPYHRFAVLLKNNYDILKLNWSGVNSTLIDLAEIQDFLLRLSKLDIGIALVPNFMYRDIYYACDTIIIHNVDNFIESIKGHDVIIYSVSKVVPLDFTWVENTTYNVRLKIINDEFK